jgi:putative endonuclease
VQTIRQRHGSQGEDVAVAWLNDQRWRVIARNVRIGRHDEIDVVAVDPGPPAELVCVEVRSARSVAFGAPEERVDSAKVGHMYRAALAFARSVEARELGVSHFPVRVDLLIVDLRRSDAAVRHLIRLEPA